MGHRLSKIYTRTGDSGTTALGDGSRVAKDSPRIEAYGTLDELNSHVGMILALEVPDTVRECLNEVQHLLFDLGGELCVPDSLSITSGHIDWLEQTLDRFNADLPWLQEFILPAGNQATAACHIARTVCRRCERVCVSLAREAPVNPFALTFLNRLSDLLFVIARILARQNGGTEVLWRPGGRGESC
jgi:cob(I)alamin adenosyltransferase